MRPPVARGKVPVAVFGCSRIGYAELVAPASRPAAGWTVVKVGRFMSNGAGRREPSVLTRVVPNSMADEDAHLSAFLPKEARLADGDPDAEGESSTRLLRFVGLTMAAGAGDASK